MSTPKPFAPFFPLPPPRSDVYIGSDAVPATRRPNATRSGHIWSSDGFGVETIVVSPGQPGYCTSCTYYVGVLGYTNTTFRILAKTRSAEPVPLIVRGGRRNAY